MKHSTSLSRALLIISFVATTLNSFAQQLSLQLNPSNYNGYQISCFGGRDGNINLTITGGSGLYSFHWTTGDTTEDVHNLAAGYYGVDIWEIINGIDSNYFRGEITLTQPDQLVLSPIILQYPNSYGVSGDSVCDGSIQINLSGGVSPYSYQWNDTNTSQSRSSLCSGQYSVLATDNNGCSLSSEHFYISSPVNTGWTINDSTLTLNSDGNVDINGNVNADSILLTSHLTSPTIRVKDSLEIGNSIWLGGKSASEANRMYTDDGDLYIQSQDNELYNTHFNVENTNEIGIGTDSPSARLHIYDNATDPARNYRPYNNCDPLFKASYFSSDPGNNGCATIRRILSVENIDGGSIRSSFIINSNGFVGIGVDEPSQQFEVDGNIKTGGLIVNSLVGGGSSLVQSSSAGVLSKIPLNNSSSYVLSGSGTWISTSNFSQWTTSQGNIVSNSEGKVGVGTSSPAQKLHVMGNSIFTKTTESIISAPFIKGGNVLSGPSTPDYSWWGDTLTGIFHPATNRIAFSIAGSEKMRIDSLGNIGIGTVSPGTGYKLDVVGTLNSTDIRINGEPLNNSFWSKGGNSGSNPITQFIGTTDSNDFVFRTNNTARLKIDKNGIVSFAEGATFGKLLANRITSLDTVLYVGDSSIIISTQGNANKIYPSQTGGNHGMSIGSPTAFGHGKYALAVGNNVYADAENSITVGSGYNWGNALRNSSHTNTFYLGFNSDLPTFVVTPANGVGSTGNVGIGLGNQLPTEKLEVGGFVKISSLSGSGTSIVTADANGKLGVTSGGSNQVLTGTGGWVNSQSLGQWLAGVNSGDIYYSNGNVGIGTNAPREALDINGNISIEGSYLHLGTNDGRTGSSYPHHALSHSSLDELLINQDGNFAGGVVINSLPVVEGLNNFHALSIAYPGSNPNSNPTKINFLVYGDGRVRAREIKVTLADPFPDFVFEKKYKLKSIDDLEKYIIANRHLPDLPTSEEVKNNGMDLGSMQIKLLQKIEELTLYVIQLKDENEKIKEELEAIKNK